eukprot:6932714-Prymnesium_polylepis.1
MEPPYRTLVSRSHTSPPPPLHSRHARPHAHAQRARRRKRSQLRRASRCTRGARLWRRLWRRRRAHVSSPRA